MKMTTMSVGSIGMLLVNYTHNYHPFAAKTCSFSLTPLRSIQVLHNCRDNFVS